MTIFIKLSILGSCCKRWRIICVFSMTKLIVAYCVVWYCSMVVILTLRGEKNIIVTNPAALFLPETLWTHLPNTLEEGEAFGSNFQICSCPKPR